MRYLYLGKAALIGSVAFAGGIARAEGLIRDDDQNHWAYAALDRAAREGLLGDSPRLLLGSVRPATRYEMAVGFRRMYSNLRRRANRGRTRAQDLKDLTRATEAFQSELSGLGVDLKSMRTDLLAMAARKDEVRKPPIDIRGEADLWIGAGQGREQSYGLNKDGRLIGTSNPSPGALLQAPVGFEAGLQKDYTFLHEGAFTFSGTDPNGPQWTGTLVVTDLFGNANAGTFAFGNQSDVISPAYGANVGYPVTGYRTGQEDLYLQNAGIRVGGPRTNFTLGRLGYSVSPYMFQRLDNTSYFSNERWDNGLYYFDGAILGFDFGRAKLDVFGGRTSGLTSTNDVEVDPLRTGPYGGPFGSATVATGTRFNIDNSIGANLKVAMGNAAHVNLAYLYLNSNTDTVLQPGTSANRLDVYGADATARLGPVDVQGGYHKSNLMFNGSSVNSSDNGAWNLRLQAERNRFSVFGEYRQIEANYLAPGDWGRLGVLRNPSNIKGFRVGGSVDVTRRLTLSATGEFDTGVSDNFAPTTFLGPHTAVDAFDVKVSYKLRHDLSVYGEYENTHFGSLAAPSSYAGSGDPNYQWATFGLGYGLASNARFDIRYELSDISNDYQVSNGVGFHGGFLTTQLTIRF